MARLQIHYTPPSLGEPINLVQKTEAAFLAKISEIIATLLVEECDLRVSKDGEDITLKLHLEISPVALDEPVIIERI